MYTAPTETRGFCEFTSESELDHKPLTATREKLPGTSASRTFDDSFLYWKLSL